MVATNELKKLAINGNEALITGRLVRSAKRSYTYKGVRYEHDGSAQADAWAAEGARRRDDFVMPRVVEQPIGENIVVAPRRTTVQSRPNVQPVMYAQAKRRTRLPIIPDDKDDEEEDEDIIVAPRKKVKVTARVSSSRSSEAHPDSESDSELSAPGSGSVDGGTRSNDATESDTVHTPRHTGTQEETLPRVEAKFTKPKAAPSAGSPASDTEMAGAELTDNYVPAQQVAQTARIVEDTPPRESTSDSE